MAVRERGNGAGLYVEGGCISRIQRGVRLLVTNPGRRPGPKESPGSYGLYSRFGVGRSRDDADLNAQGGGGWSRQIGGSSSPRFRMVLQWQIAPSPSCSRTEKPSKALKQRER